MALRLRKDVQKASYYVWFLGAQEAKALRGTRTLLPMIPRMVEKSKEQEPLKVTLQVSHKGLKIVQGSAKHFIPHGAITCSVQTEDIVACTLLLYNPATKCPLHVHAYRCDSELTAQALHDQLQILINRPENQKRYTELETRLGLAAQLAGGPCGPATHPSTTSSAIATTPLDGGGGGGGGGRGNNNRMGRRYESPRRTAGGAAAYHHNPHHPHHPGDSHSQHGSSDTGTSTRESECSEEHSPTSPALSPLISQSKLYDSLAAELREKLSGGVPLLLPTKEYGDKTSPTLATEAANRRIRTSGVCLTGGTNTPSTGHNKHGVSSRGSSGIGSDLAPSPERHDPPSSSEDEWVNDQEPALQGSSHNLVGSRATRDSRGGYRDEIRDGPVTRMSQYRDAPPTAYLYPNVRDEAPIQAARNRHHQRSSSREENRSLQGSVNSHEEEVKPIITNHTPRYRNPFKSTEEAYVVEERRSKKVPEGKKYYDEPVAVGGRGRGGCRSYPPEDRIEEPAPVGGRGYFEDEYERERANAYRENLTDRQKYREIVSDGSGKGYRKEYDRRGPSMGYGEPQQHHRGEYHHREYSPERPVPTAAVGNGMQSSGGRSKHVAPPQQQHERQDFKIEREAYQQRGGGGGHAPAPTNPVRSSRESSGYKVDRAGQVAAAGHQRYSRSGDDQHDGVGVSHGMYRDGRHAMDRGHDSPRTGYKMADKYEERWRQEAMAVGVQDRYIDPEPATSTAHRRPYHREEQSKHTSAPGAVVESWKGAGTEVPRKKSVEIRTSSPESTMHRISPKDRFQTAKEKFQQMERERHEQERLEQERLERERLLHSKRTVEVHTSAIPPRRGSLEPTAVSSHDSNGWSSPDEEEEEEEDEEEDLRHGRGGRSSNGGSSDRRAPVSYRELSPAERFPGLDREPPPPGRGPRMMPAKSLSNLVKGYRHSYAEPRPPPVSRSSGRVGLAAVNPY